MAAEYDSTGRVLNVAQRTRLAGIRRELEAMAAKPNLTQADYDRTLDLERQIQLIDAGPDSGVREYGGVPMFWQEHGYKRGNGQFNNGRGAGEGYTRTPDTERGIFARWMRTGDPGAASELRAYNDVDMVTSVDAEGGVTVPSEMLREVISRRDELMLAIRLGCRKIPGNAKTITIPIDNEADVLYTAVNEASSISQDAPALDEVSLTLQKYAKFTTASWELQMSEDANLLNFLMGWMARGMAATHNQLLVSEVLLNGSAGVTADAITAIGAKEIPELAGKVAPEYKDVSPGAKWLMNQSTFSYLQGLQGDSFLFAPMPGGDPFKPGLWGYEVAQSSHMPAIGSGNKSLVHGNFGYVAYRDPASLVVLRDQFSAAATGQVRYWSYFFTDYAVTQGESLSYLTHPTAV